jgi:hypothetical protein
MAKPVSVTLDAFTCDALKKQAEEDCIHFGLPVGAITISKAIERAVNFYLDAHRARLFAKFNKQIMDVVKKDIRKGVRERAATLSPAAKKRFLAADRMARRSTEGV